MKGMPPPSLLNSSTRPWLNAQIILFFNHREESHYLLYPTGVAVGWVNVSLKQRRRGPYNPTTTEESLFLVVPPPNLATTAASAAKIAFQRVFVLNWVRDDVELSVSALPALELSQTTGPATR
jgi:hypothetical protein